MDAIDLPAPLRWGLRRSVVEVLVIGLQKSKVDLVELVIEYLLWELVAMRSRVGPEQNPVLILLKECPRRSRLAAQLPNARSNVDVHVLEPVQIFGDVGEILRKVADVQRDEPGLGMARDHPVPSLEQLSITRK